MKASNAELKNIVKEKYGEIADQSRVENAGSCCGSSCGCATVDYEVMAENYDQLAGYVKDADLGLGCGLPTEFANIREGDMVIDLGSGAGNDCFVARSITGPTGKVIGIDMTEKMINKARFNAEKLGYHNVEFRLGDIEDLPVSSNLANVVVSNCVMNLVPDKQKAFEETYRVLKPGGHFSISDIVIIGDLPPGLKESAELYAGCVSGAIQKTAYLQTIIDAGFVNVQLQKERAIELPDELLAKFLQGEDIEAYHCRKFGIFSITVYGEKPDQR